MYTDISSTLLFESAELLLKTGTLIKTIDDSDPTTTTDAQVYYYGSDKKRHLIPSEEVYFTWYKDFNAVKEISTNLMASISLGKNVTIKPGSKIIKFLNSEDKYLVSFKNTLHIIKDEVLKAIYGENWLNYLITLSDALFNNYILDDEIKDIEQYDKENQLQKAQSINDIL